MKSAVKFWWVSLLLGVLLILFGIWIIRTPVESFLALSILFAVMFLVSGIMEIFYSLSNRKEVDGWGWYLAGGLLDSVLGLFILTHPSATLVIMTFFISFWLIFRAIMAIGGAFEMRSYGVKDWGWILVLGILTLILAFILMFNPVFVGLTVIIWISMAFFILGIFRIILAFDLRKLHKLGKSGETDVTA